MRFITVKSYWKSIRCLRGGGDYEQRRKRSTRTMDDIPRMATNKRNVSM
jgi:hypothetical protein